MHQVYESGVKDLRSASIGSLCDTQDSRGCLASAPDRGQVFVVGTWNLGPRGGQLNGMDGSGRPITWGGDSEADMTDRWGAG